MIEWYTALMTIIMITGPEDGVVVYHPLFSAQAELISANAQLLDKRELRYVFANPKDFAADINTVRKRFIELADAPPEEDAVRFPPRDIINEFLAFNRSYRMTIESKREIDRHNYWYYGEVLNEIDEVYQLWDLVSPFRVHYTTP